MISIGRVVYEVGDRSDADRYNFLEAVKSVEKMF